MSDIVHCVIRLSHLRSKAVMFGFVAQLVVLMATPAAAGIDESRKSFADAEIAIAREKPQQARQLIAKLQHYPLVGYLELALALQQLPTATHQTIAAVMRRRGGEPSAFLLRRAWLKKLARERRWDSLLTHHVEDDHKPSACLAAQAKWQLGKLDEAWLDARRLWLTGRSLPDLCDPLLDAWRDAGQLSGQLAWDRAKLAMARNEVKLANHLRRYASRNHTVLLDRWVSLHSQPSQLSEFVRTADVTNADVAHVIVAVFKRAARRDAMLAKELLANLSSKRLAASVMGQLRDRLSLALADSGDDEAVSWLKYASSPDALTAQAVNALREGRHDTVLRAIKAMGAQQAQRERWRYWRANALAGMGRDDQAGKALHALASERSYYGFLAADQVHKPYSLGHSTLVSPPTRLDALGNDIRLRRTREWLALRRSIDARREWHALLNSLDTDGQRDAAILANSWGWHEGGIRAAAKAAAWDDLDIRFPMAHRTEVNRAATQSKLSASRVYAIIRQESAFMHDIRSSAGALGLMQLMPSTARQVARKAGRAKPNHAAILNPRNNLLLGSLYLARLQSRYDGNAVLATAAYNAGPSRVRRWRQMPRAMASKDWIEMIPFRETRRYVRRVLAYQIIYADRLGEKAFRLRDLMMPVKPISD